MVGYFADYTDHSFYAAAVVCLIIDLYLLQKSGPLLCIGMGSLITGVLISLGLIESYPVALVMLAGFSCAAGGLLWEYSKPQDEQIQPLTNTDSCTGTESPAHLDAYSEAPINAKAQVEVARADGKRMLVRLA